MESVIIALLIAAALFLLWLSYLTGRRIEENEWKLNKIKPIVESRIKASRAVLGGQFSEQLAPYLPDFRYSPTECRFIGKPIDFIVFKGMDKGIIEEVIFVEVKSGNSRTLNLREKSLRRAVEEKRVSWEFYQVPGEIIKKDQ
jgi:predicted Holliday junction resolvase-like endonuclease